MAYKDPNDPRKTDARRVQKDFEYANSERGFVTSCISRKFKPSAKKYGGHLAHESMDKKEFWRLYMNHIIIMKEKFPNSDGRLCKYCEQPFTFKTNVRTRGKGYQGRGPQNPNNFSIDRLDPRLTYQTNNIVFCCFGCNDRKKNSTPDDWRNFIRVEKELINDR
jgi:5-methylcytosine-specific restriction endonuclease McrA